MFSRKLTLVIYNLECGFFRDRHAQMGVTLIIYNFGGEIFDLKSLCFEGLLFISQTNTILSRNANAGNLRPDLFFQVFGFENKTTYAHKHTKK